MEDLEFKKQVIKLLNRMNESLEGIQAALEVIVEDINEMKESATEEEADGLEEIAGLTDKEG